MPLPGRGLWCSTPRPYNAPGTKVAQTNRCVEVNTRMKRSGMMLVVAGLLVLVFFLATDAAIMPAWMEKLGWGRNQVDAVTDSRWGTAIGVVGSLAVIVTGLWLLVRRSV